MYGPKLPELRGKHHPETEVDVAAFGGVAAIGSTAVGGAVAPTATANHAEGARIISNTTATRITFIPIVTPFPHIPAHVVQTQPVGAFGAYRVRLAVGITAIPGIALQAAFAVGASPFGAIGRAASGGILPLCLSGQSVVLSCQAI